MRSQAAGHGKIVPRCVPEGASDGKSAPWWQHIAAMYSDTAYFGKICAPCIQKAPQSAVGEYAVRTSCHQGAFSPSEAPKIMHGARILPPSDGLAPAQGLPPEQPHRGIAFQRLGPCAGMPAPPSEPQRRTPLGISLKEGEMRAAPRFNKCSTQCAVDYRIRIGFEYQSVSLLA